MVTDDMPLFGKSPSSVGEFDLVIGYRCVTSEWHERLSSLDGPFLHVGNLTLPDYGWNSSTVCVRKGSFQRCFDDKNGPIRSIVARITCEGNYSFPGWFDNDPHILKTIDNQTSFPVYLNDSFIDGVSFEPRPFGYQLAGTPGTLVCKLFSDTFGDSDILLISAPFDSTRILKQSHVVAHGSRIVWAGAGSSSDDWSFSPPLSVAPDPGGGPLPSAPFDFIGPSKQSPLLAEGTTVIWVGVTSSLAVLLMIIMGILLVVILRPRSKRSASAVAESELDIPTDGDGQAAKAAAGFVSEENALTQDGSRSGRIRVNDDGHDKNHLSEALRE
jgi:hypothetical protein